MAVCRIELLCTVMSKKISTCSSQVTDLPSSERPLEVILVTRESKVVLSKEVTSRKRSGQASLRRNVTRVAFPPLLQYGWLSSSCISLSNKIRKKASKAFCSMVRVIMVVQEAELREKIVVGLS